METTHQSDGSENDKELWRIAKKRVGFKKHLTVYILVNCMLWIIWLLNDKNNNKGSNFPWPIWPMFGWGVGLAFSYLDAYIFTKKDAIEKEYEKLKNKLS